MVDRYDPEIEAALSDFKAQLLKDEDAAKNLKRARDKKDKNAFEIVIKNVFSALGYAIDTVVNLIKSLLDRVFG